MGREEESGCSWCLAAAQRRSQLSVRGYGVFMGFDGYGPVGEASRLHGLLVDFLLRIIIVL